MLLDKTVPQEAEETAHVFWLNIWVTRKSENSCKLQQLRKNQFRFVIMADGLFPIIGRDFFDHLGAEIKQQPPPKKYSLGRSMPN